MCDLPWNKVDPITHRLGWSTKVTLNLKILNMFTIMLQQLHPPASLILTNTVIYYLAYLETHLVGMLGKHPSNGRSSHAATTARSP